MSPKHRYPDTRGSTDRDSTGRRGVLSAPQYFLIVALVTIALFTVAAFMRPAFAADIAILTGLKKAPVAADGSFYTARIAPLFDESCASCHGASRAKGDLRLDNFAGLMRGGKGGSVLAAGNPEASELYRRLLLPQEDELAMPPKGKEPFSPDEMEVIKLWIAHGASGELPLAAIPNAPEPVRKIEFPKAEPAEIAKARAPHKAAFDQLQQRYQGMIAYESRISANVHVNAALSRDKFDDADLAALAPLADKIVALDLSNTQVTDASAKQLAAFSNVRILRLMNTAITEETMAAIADLSGLEALSVFGTRVSEQAVAPLKARGVRVYGTVSAANAATGK